MRLLKTHLLTFTRTADGDGYLDPETRQWVSGEDTSEVIAQGSLQPFRGRTREYQENGLRQSDLKVFYTPTLLRSVNEYTMQEADEVTLDGITYIVVSTENWRIPGSSIGHYRVLLGQKDKLGG